MKRRPRSCATLHVVALPAKKSATRSPGEVESSMRNFGIASGKVAGCGFSPLARQARRYASFDELFGATMRLDAIAPPLSFPNFSDIPQPDGREAFFCPRAMSLRMESE